jgi:UDP-hydrolysing UDP-N-acetyl-D-glucosamine 2-epimerase
MHLDQTIDLSCADKATNNHMTKRRIAVFTGNRAEYGLQQPIAKAVSEHPDLELNLLVSGTHLNEDFGATAAEIRKDGFENCTEVRIGSADNGKKFTAMAIGNGVIAISQELERSRPDVLVVYGDRFEGFAAVIAGTQMNIPTAHIEGGDITEGGALDDSVRHAMTKLAHIHFTTNEQASNRVLAMGEEPWRIHTVGFPVIDLLNQGAYASPEELNSRYGLDPEKPIIVFTQHSVTTEPDQATRQISPSLRAIERLAHEGVQAVLTYPNNDEGGLQIIEALKKFEAKNIPGILLEKSLGRYNYHGLLGLAKDPHNKILCAGNSSSGIKETPALGCPTINVGTRQKGRLRGDNVLDTGYDETEIYQAAKKCFEDSCFRAVCANTDNPYGKGQSGEIIADILATLDIGDASILQKGMTLSGETSNGKFR